MTDVLRLDDRESAEKLAKSLMKFCRAEYVVEESDAFPNDQ